MWSSMDLLLCRVWGNEAGLRLRSARVLAISLVMHREALVLHSGWSIFELHE